MNYKELPDDTRIWIYQANRQLTSEEVQSINQSGEKFINEWTAHGAKLKAALEIFYDQFVVLFADENQANASGCSIDKSVHFIKEIEREFSITLMDRNLVTYKDGNKIMTCTRAKFSEQLGNGSINEQTFVYNNLVYTKEEFESNWQIPLKDSWHRKLITN